MREILFRGKRIDNGEWVYGHYGEYTNMRSETISAMSVPNKNSIYGNLCYDVDPSTVGQYTGLTDKNGKKIFEGDIVFYWCSDIVAVVKFGEYQDSDSTKKAYGYFVEYLEDGKIVQENMDSREKDDEYGCEVIGNIHDNPELLGGDI